VHVNCPGLSLSLLGLVTVQVGVYVEVDLAGQWVIVATCPTGPPRPF
jgi:hypothetical protein